MRLLSYMHQGVESYSCHHWRQRGQPGRAFPQYPTSGRIHWLWAPTQAAEHARTQPVDGPLATLHYLPVIRASWKRSCVRCAITWTTTRRFWRRACTGAGAAADLPARMALPVKCQPAHRQPSVSDSLDWEGELAVIIGKPGRNIPLAQAWDHVAGYACYNDASVREWQFHAKQIASGKNFEQTGRLRSVDGHRRRDRPGPPAQTGSQAQRQGRAVQPYRAHDL